MWRLKSTQVTNIVASLPPSPPLPAFASLCYERDIHTYIIIVCVL